MDRSLGLSLATAPSTPDPDAVTPKTLILSGIGIFGMVFLIYRLEVEAGLLEATLIVAFLVGLMAWPNWGSSPPD